MVEENVRIHRIPALRRRVDRSDLGQVLCFAISALFLAPRFLRAERSEAVIAFFTIPSGVIGYWLKARRGIPYVITLRGADVPGLVPELVSTHRSLRWLRRRVLGSAQSVVANSLGLADLSKRADPFPVAVVPNGVDSELFQPIKRSSAGELEDRFKILFVGRLGRQKNLELLLEQLACLRSQGLKTITLDVVGDGPLRGSLREQAAGLGLGSCIAWHGWVANSEVVAHYQAADCFVNPSFYEGLPNTVLEAMACGLPVVASRVDGHESLVLDQETGLLFALERPEHLGAALSSLVGDRARARRMGAAGRARVVEHFSWGSVAKAFLRLFRETDPQGISHEDDR